MTAITFTFDDSQLQRALGELQQAIGDMTPVMRQIGHDLQEEIRLQLGQDQTPWGEPTLNPQ